MLVLQSFCFQHQQNCLRGYKGCLEDILSLSVDQSPLQLCFPALYWARAALRPLITSQHLHLTVSREEDLLCSRPQAGGINGLMTLILSRAGAIRSLVARWIDQVCPSESKRFVYKISSYVRISCEFCPNFMLNLSVFIANVVRIKIEFCPLFMRPLSASE